MSVTPVLVFHDVRELITNSTFQKTGNEGKERLIIQGDPAQLFILCLVVISSLLMKKSLNAKRIINSTKSINRKSAKSKRKFFLLDRKLLNSK